MHENGVPLADLAKGLGFAEDTIYTQKAKYGSAAMGEAKRLKELEAENKNKN